MFYFFLTLVAFFFLTLFFTLFCRLLFFETSFSPFFFFSSFFFLLIFSGENIPTGVRRKDGNVIKNRAVFSRWPRCPSLSSLPVARPSPSERSVPACSAYTLVRHLRPCSANKETKLKKKKKHTHTSRVGFRAL